MRIRTIKPEFWTDEKISVLAPETCLLAIGLLNYADDEGFFNANPLLIKAALMPLRTTSKTIEMMMEELAAMGWTIVRKCSDGTLCGCIAHFKEHQVISHPRPSKLGVVFNDSANHPATTPEPSVNGMGTLPDASGLIPAGMEGKGKEQGKEQGRRGKSLGIVPSDQPEPVRSRMLRVNVLKHRKAGTRWSTGEFEAFRAAGLDSCSDDDFAEQHEPLHAYYAATLAADQDFRRMDLQTLLNHWPGEVDRATAWCHANAKKSEELLAGRL